MNQYAEVEYRLNGSSRAWVSDLFVVLRSTNHEFLRLTLLPCLQTAVTMVQLTVLIAGK
jgi:hypothetical protein